MRRLAFILVLMATAAAAQMQSAILQATATTGQPGSIQLQALLPGATAYVCTGAATSCASPGTATLYSNYAGTSQQAQPLVADANGRMLFFWAPGTYTVTITPPTGSIGSVQTYVFTVGLSTTQELSIAPVAPAAPSTVSVTNVGTTGSTTYYYWVVSKFTLGNSAPSLAAETTTSAATLSSYNYNAISWSSVTGANTYDVLRTSTSTAPTGSCNCAVATGVSGTSENDQSNSLSSYTVSTYAGNTTFNITNTAVGAAESALNFTADHGTKFSIDNIKGVTISGGAIEATNGISSSLAYADVRKYGAMCDGTTDDTTALQTGLTDSATVPLYIPAGCTLKVTSQLTYPTGAHVFGGSNQNAQAIIEPEYTVPASTTDVVLGPGSGATAANAIFDGFTIYAANVAATDSSSLLQGLLLPKAEQSQVLHLNIVPPSGWSGGVTQGLVLTNTSGGSAFYGTVAFNSFGAWSSDIALIGVSGGQINSWTFLDNLLQGTGTTSNGVVDITYAASNSWLDNQFPVGTYAFVLHGPNITAQYISGGYTDGGHSAPFLYGASFTNQTNVVTVDSVPGLASALTEVSGFPTGAVTYIANGELNVAQVDVPGMWASGCSAPTQPGINYCSGNTTAITATALESEIGNPGGSGIVQEIAGNYSGNNTHAGIGYCREDVVDPANYGNYFVACVQKDTLSSYIPTLHWYYRSGPSTISDDYQWGHTSSVLPGSLAWGGGSAIPSSSSLALSGADGISAGTITLSTGSGSHTFTTAYTAAPVCVANDTSDGTKTFTISTSTTAVTIASGNASDVIAFVCYPAKN